VRESTKYVAKRIHQWTDLEMMRNIFIAHNFRDKLNDNRLVKPFDKDLIIPKEYPDYVLLCGCIHYIHIILTRVFLDEMKTLTLIIKDRTAPTIKLGMATVEDALNELQSIIDKSDIGGYICK